MAPDVLFALLLSLSMYCIFPSVLCDAADHNDEHRQRYFGSGGVTNDGATICVAMPSVKRDVENYVEGTMVNLLNTLPREALPVHVVVGGAELDYLERVSHLQAFRIHPWSERADHVRRSVSTHYAASLNYIRALGVYESHCKEQQPHSTAKQRRRGLLVVEDDVVLNDEFYEHLLESIVEAEQRHDAFWLDCYTPPKLDCMPYDTAVHIGQYDAQCCTQCRYYSPKAALMLRDELLRHATKFASNPKG